MVRELSLLPVMQQRLKQKLTKKAWSEYQNRLSDLLTEEEQIWFTRRCFMTLSESNFSEIQKAEDTSTISRCCHNCVHSIINMNSIYGWMGCAVGSKGNFPKAIHNCRRFERRKKKKQ